MFIGFESESEELLILFVFDLFLVFSDASGAGSEKRHHNSSSLYGSLNDSARMRDPGTTKFTITEILKATKNFSPNLKIGQGGFGTVYKGRLEDGTFVAVKRAKKVGICY